ncbi:MAG: SDR family NAD(P)-dependent oxidoreductase [Gemmobacter sp.]|nr:SDR family NAD(P)-dependent oxidoreductase [Gemmobacter sp.]
MNAVWAFDSFRFSGTSVVVAGGTSGTNLGIADGFVAAGAQVAVMSRNAERVETAAAHLRRHGGNVLGVTGDVSDMEQVRAAMAKAHAAHGDFDVLVSGAAGNFLCPALDLSSNGFKVVIDIDLNGTFHVMRCGYDFALRPGASFINISAPQSTSPAPMQLHVCAARQGWFRSCGCWRWNRARWESG